MRCFGLAVWLLLRCGTIPAYANSADPVPETEVGNAITRDLDRLADTLGPLYLGHVGILGEWSGVDASDPAEYDVYDLQEVGGDWTITKRAFADFTHINTLTKQNYLSYQGGYVRSDSAAAAPRGAPMSPFLRNQVIIKAETWVGSDLTYKFFPFTKLASTNTFRCDGWVEYIFEQAGIGEDPDVFGAIPQGIWKNYLEHLIVAPQMYASPVFVTHREPGLAPRFSITALGGADVSDGGAISSTTITVSSTETATGSGLALIVLSGPSPDSRAISGLTASETFSGIADGSYSVTVYDLAGNARVSGFEIFTGTPKPNAKAGVDDANSQTAPLTNNNCIILKDPDPIGVSEISSDFSISTAIFDASYSTAIYVTQICSVSTGTYNVYSKNRAGKTGSKVVAISSAAYQMTVSGAGSGWSDSNSVAVANIANMQLRFGAVSGLTNCSALDVKLNGVLATCQPQCPGCAVEYTATNGPTGKTASWSATNTSTTTSFNSTIAVGVDLGPIGTPGYTASITFNAAPHPYSIPPSGGIGGAITIPEAAATTYAHSFYGSTLTVTSPYNGVDLSTRAALTGAEESARLRQVLRQSGYIVDVTADGGMAVFSSTMSLSFAYTDAVADTTTARIFRFKNSASAWEPTFVSSQSITRSGNDITAFGNSTCTATFVVFFAGQDSSAPVTSFTIQGSSFVFDQALFVSTDAFAVLTATDPVVSGYASTVASVTYRIDPTSGTAFTIYQSSFPLALGTHILEYRAIDYAGNIESIKTTTFTVTAGTAMRTTSTARVPGTLLNGFLGSGAKLEIESQAENALTLLVSSANRQGLLAIDNIGEVGVGLTAPQANLNLGQASIALQLRSGNSNASVTSDQITFGYNGDYAMRHFLRTEHSTSTDGNKMDFLIWNPGAGSTTTLAALNTLSLQGIATASGGSFHVQPFGEPDAEVEVSNGLSTGGGTMQRLQMVAPSSRRFKTDIKDLSERDEDRALEDVAGLKHASFRYKSKSDAGPQLTGLIYEDAPQSIRDGDNALSTSERLVNVEMALKATMRRLAELQKRYEKLKRRNP